VSDTAGPGSIAELLVPILWCHSPSFCAPLSGTAQNANRVELIAELDKHGHRGADDKQPELRGEVTERLRQEVEQINVNNFIVRPKRKLVENYGNAAAWQSLGDDKKSPK
jgi:hypothetical protein